MGVSLGTKLKETKRLFSDRSGGESKQLKREMALVPAKLKSQRT